MRLLFVIDSLGSGGAQRQLVALGLGLAQRGHAIEFFVYHPQHRHFAAPLEQCQIPIHSAAKVSRWSLGPVRALRQLVRTGGYDGLLAFLPTPSFYGEIAGLGLRRPPLVVSQRFTFTSGSLGFGGWLQQQAHRLADHITVNSHSQRERMERMFPWMRSKISTIYNGVDLALFRPPWQVVTHRGGLELLAIGSVLPGKNALGLIRALALNRARYGTSCIVRWAGKLGADAGAKAEFLAAERLLAEFGLRECWHWLGERADVPELLGSHDALIHPSLSEGLPNAICEALASGLPVLAGSVSDNERLVQDGVTGFVFDPTEPADIAASIRRLADLSETERARMRHAARSFAGHNLSLSRMVDSYEELLTQLALPARGAA